MHVSPPEFRAVRRDGVLLQYAVLGPVMYALADFPDGGSRGTFAEAWCETPHWALTARGDLEIDLDGERVAVAPGTAIHVPAGVRHRFLVAGRARLSGFEPLRKAPAEVDEALRAAGFETVTGVPPASALAVSLHRPTPEPAPARGEVLASTRQMGDLLVTRVRLGRLAGYTSERCDVEHWGLVLSGAMAIESEDDVEIVSAGDVFYCPPGPPGHRMQAAEPATVVDFTPVESLRTAPRVVEWRREHARRALAEHREDTRLEMAALG